MTNRTAESAYTREEIGKRIAKKRNEKKLSQSDLARLTLSTQELIAKIEKGQRNIQNDLLIRISDALDTNTDYILRGIDTDNLSIADETHLDNAAINNLRQFLDSDVLMQLDNAKEAVNWMLSSRDGFSIIAQLYAYLNADCSQVAFSDKLFPSDSLRIPLKSGIQKDHVSASYHLTEEDFSDMLLHKIMFNLKALRSNYSHN